jgi:RimJ/RimL family protein N-acetyltransferase
MTTIWGKQIGLRPFTDPISDDEVARLYRWCRDQDLLRLSGGTPTDLSLSEFCEQLRGDHRDQPDQRMVFFILRRSFDGVDAEPSRNDHGELIGRIGCFAIDWARRDCELGVVIGEATEWGKGYGRAAIILLLQHLFETTWLERVYLFTYPENIRAQRCFAACGFRPRGTVQRFSIERGEHDGAEMEITRREFMDRWNMDAQMSSALLEKCPSESS